MRRLPDWPERLHHYFDSVARQPFCYGVHDCARFAREVVHSITGEWIDEAAFEGYKDRKSALRLIEAMPLRKRVSRCLGSSTSAALARRGDVVLYTHERHGDALGVCDGMRFFAPGDQRLEARPMSEAVRAWWVG